MIVQERRMMVAYGNDNTKGREWKGQAKRTSIESVQEAVGGAGSHELAHD